MANHKRKGRRGRSSCGLCKPHKKPGCRRERARWKTYTLQEIADMLGAHIELAKDMKQLIKEHLRK